MSLNNVASGTAGFISCEDKSWVLEIYQVLKSDAHYIYVRQMQLLNN